MDKIGKTQMAYGNTGVRPTSPKVSEEQSGGDTGKVRSGIEKLEDKFKGSVASSTPQAEGTTETQAISSSELKKYEGREANTVERLEGFAVVDAKGPDGNLVKVPACVSADGKVMDKIEACTFKFANEKWNNDIDYFLNPNSNASKEIPADVLQKNRTYLKEKMGETIKELQAEKKDMNDLELNSRLTAKITKDMMDPEKPKDPALASIQKSAYQYQDAVMRDLCKSPISNQSITPDYVSNIAKGFTGQKLNEIKTMASPEQKAGLINLLTQLINLPQIKAQPAILENIKGVMNQLQ